MLTAGARTKLLRRRGTKAVGRSRGFVQQSDLKPRPLPNVIELSLDLVQSQTNGNATTTQPAEQVL